MVPRFLPIPTEPRAGRGGIQKKKRWHVQLTCWLDVCIHHDVGTRHRLYFYNPSHKGHEDSIVNVGTTRPCYAERSGYNTQLAGYTRYRPEVGSLLRSRYWPQIHLVTLILSQNSLKRCQDPRARIDDRQVLPFGWVVPIMTAKRGLDVNKWGGFGKFDGARVYRPCGVLPTLNSASPHSRPFLLDSSPPQGPDFCVGNSHQKTSLVCPCNFNCYSPLVALFSSSLLHWLTLGCRIFRAPVFQGNGVRLEAVIVPRWDPNMCLSPPLVHICLEWLVSNSPFSGAARPGLAG